jgi:hypothetical protein
MQFQPGQSGNPAGRPPGARNKKTIAIEEMLAEQAEAAVKKILRMAEEGDPTAMRLCIERMNPTGANRRLGLELPRVKAADDADAAVQLVLNAFGGGEISIKELTHMLAAVDRLVRLGGNIEQMRYSENFRREADQGDWEIDNAFPPYHDTPGADALAAGHCMCPCRRHKLDAPRAATTGKYRAPQQVGPDGRLYSPVNSADDASEAPARNNGNGNGRQ